MGRKGAPMGFDCKELICWTPLPSISERENVLCFKPWVFCYAASVSYWSCCSLDLYSFSSFLPWFVFLTLFSEVCVCGVRCALFPEAICGLCDESERTSFQSLLFLAWHLFPQRTGGWRFIMSRMFVQVEGKLVKMYCWRSVLKQKAP